jgi:hypothetical protein
MTAAAAGKAVDFSPVLGGQNRGSACVQVRWHLVRQRPGANLPEHYIGKWLVQCPAMDWVLPRSTALCVVNDFGDLVPVTYRGAA